MCDGYQHHTKALLIIMSCLKRLVQPRSNDISHVNATFQFVGWELQCHSILWHAGWWHRGFENAVTEQPGCFSTYTLAHTWSNLLCPTEQQSTWMSRKEGREQPWRVKQCTRTVRSLWEPYHRHRQPLRPSVWPRRCLRTCVVLQVSVRTRRLVRSRSKHFQPGEQHKCVNSHPLLQAT